MIKRKKLYILAALATAGVVGLASQSFAAHPAQDAVTCPTCPPGGNVQLKDAAGVAIAALSATPYSPKQTCGTAACHDYESAWTTATKTQFNRLGNLVSYDVPYPEHGVSAGYHFQQGRNMDWDESTMRDAYGLPKFTSSAGMYGKY